MFIGREMELKLLNKLYRSDKSELFVLYGRRRIGKTELLKQFCKGKPAVLYTANQAEIQDNLQQCWQICCNSLPQADADLVFASLEALLGRLAKLSTRTKKLIIVLDEFQYWVDADRSIPSQLQRFWDKIHNQSNIMVILCGSYVGLMIDHTLAERSPLYGRRTAQLQLRALDFRSTAAFFPRWSKLDRLAVHGILGGVPAYLRQFDPNATLAENIKRCILDVGTFLSEEAEFLLKMELREIRTYATLLKAVAGGNTKLKDLSSKCHLEARSLTAYLHTLQELGFIDRKISLDERAPEQSRKGQYVVRDPFLGFWFNFVEPNRTLIEVGEGPRLFEHSIKPRLQTFLGKSFEDICAEFLLHYGSEIGLPLPQKLGSIWGADFDIDVAAQNIDGSCTFGECKWSAKQTDMAILHKLQYCARQTNFGNLPHHYVLFCPAGFNQKFVALQAENIRLASADELLPDGNFA